VVEIPNPTNIPQKKKKRLILDDKDEMTETNVEENLEYTPPKEASIKKKKKISRSKSRNRDTANLIEMEPPLPNPIEVPVSTLSIIQPTPNQIEVITKENDLPPKKEKASPLRISEKSEPPPKFTFTPKKPPFSIPMRKQPMPKVNQNKLHHQYHQRLEHQK
jgi:hypothetical protein